MTKVETFNYYGVNLPKIDEGNIALGAVVSLKIMNAEGQVGYKEYKSSEIHAIEALGMVETFSDSIRYAIMRNTQGNEA